MPDYTPIPAEELREILAYCDAASEGPWEVAVLSRCPGIEIRTRNRVVDDEKLHICALPLWKHPNLDELQANADLIANARTDLPRLAKASLADHAEISTLKKRVAELEADLEEEHEHNKRLEKKLKDWGAGCACGHDNENDVCAVHHPRIRKAETELVLAKEDTQRWADVYAEADQERIDFKARVEELEADNKRLRKAFHAAADENFCLTCGDLVPCKLHRKETAGDPNWSGSPCTFEIPALAEMRERLEKAEEEIAEWDKYFGSEVLRLDENNAGAESMARCLLDDDGRGQMCAGPCADAMRIWREMKAQRDAALEVCRGFRETMGIRDKRERDNLLWIIVERAKKLLSDNAPQPEVPDMYGQRNDAPLEGEGR